MQEIATKLFLAGCKAIRRYHSYHDVPASYRYIKPNPKLIMCVLDFCRAHAKLDDLYLGEDDLTSELVSLAEACYRICNKKAETAWEKALIKLKITPKLCAEIMFIYRNNDSDDMHDNLRVEAAVLVLKYLGRYAHGVRRYKPRKNQSFEQFLAYCEKRRILPIECSFLREVIHTPRIRRQLEAEFADFTNPKRDWCGLFYD